MKIRYYVKQFTGEGRLIDAPTYYDTPSGFSVHGYQTEQGAEDAIADFFRDATDRDFIGVKLTICKVYQEGE